MSCNLWNERLIEHLYGESEPGASAALEEHLASCDACRSRLDALRGVRTLMRDHEPEVPRAPRVLVLRDRTAARPWLMAASLLGAALLAGAGAGAGYAVVAGRGPSGSDAPTVVAVPTEDLVRQEVDRQVAAIQASLDAAARAKGPSAPPAAEPRAVTEPEMKSALATLERKWNGTRAADLGYVLDRLDASEVRTGARIGQTNQALRYVALANNPHVTQQ